MIEEDITKEIIIRDQDHHHILQEMEEEEVHQMKAKIQDLLKIQNPKILSEKKNRTQKKIEQKFGQIFLKTIKTKEETTVELEAYHYQIKLKKETIA